MLFMIMFPKSTIEGTLVMLSAVVSWNLPHVSCVKPAVCDENTQVCSLNSAHYRGNARVKLEK